MCHSVDLFRSRIARAADLEAYRGTAKLLRRLLEYCVCTKYQRFVADLSLFWFLVLERDLFCATGGWEDLYGGVKPQLTAVPQSQVIYDFVSCLYSR
jgi:hypothetical protein